MHSAGTLDSVPLTWIVIAEAAEVVASKVAPPLDVLRVLVFALLPDLVEPLDLAEEPDLAEELEVPDLVVP